jgi:hypothetical protein
MWKICLSNTKLLPLPPPVPSFCTFFIANLARSDGWKSSWDSRVLLILLASALIANKKRFRNERTYSDENPNFSFFNLICLLRLESVQVQSFYLPQRRFALNADTRQRWDFFNFTPWSSWWSFNAITRSKSRESLADLKRLEDGKRWGKLSPLCSSEEWMILLLVCVLFKVKHCWGISTTT